LPGAGKTTLAGKLSRTLKIPIYRIGEYRSKSSSPVIGVNFYAVTVINIIQLEAFLVDIGIWRDIMM